jgi:hypothetical protein
MALLTLERDGSIPTVTMSPPGTRTALSVAEEPVA